MDDPSSRLEDAWRVARSPLPAAVVAAWAGLGLVAALFVARHRTRLRRALLIAASVTAVAGATAWLLVRSVREDRHFYKYVDEVMRRPETWRGRNLYVHGCVEPGSLERAVGSAARYRFALRPSIRYDELVSVPDTRLLVTYEGALPDTFGERSEVVVKGRLGAGDVLEVAPDGVMTKCPCKYDAAGLHGPPAPRCPP
jgi:cytochrome c-type biogenesis protein CcmE